MGRINFYEVFAALAYVALGRACLRLPAAAVGRAAFALLNVAGVMVFWLWSPGVAPRLVAARMAVYVAVVVIHYALMRWMHESRRKTSWPAIVYPVALLVVFKYAQPLWGPLVAARGSSPALVQGQLAATFVGLSYTAFRLSHFAVEVRSGVARMPTLWEHMAFAFFVPTMGVGPISPGSVFIASLDSPEPDAVPAGRCLLRILVGATKYLFLAGALSHLSYADLLDDGHPHAGPIDWVVSSVGYYLYLYCNFSGFCDVAIGGAGLMGVSVVENFDHPLLARSVRDYWRRWHITLTMYLRDMFFSPVSKILARAMGSAPGRVNHAIALALFLTFVVTGVWHGVGLNFLLFGVLHGGAMVVHHYYTLFLRKRLTRAQLRRYEQSPVVRAAAVAVTFAFVTVATFAFANDVPAMIRIAHVDGALAEQRQ